MATRWRGRGRALREWVDQVAREYPARLAMTVFAAVISIFTVLLLAPFATASGQRAPFVDALFTATSAVCITGLVVVDTGEYWSDYGRVVILTGIKVGGLGVMTIASLLGMAVSKRIGLTQRLLTASEIKSSRLGEVGTLVRIIIVTATTIEAIIALVLLPRFLSLGESVGDAVWHSVFYGISAFNNAGFVPTPEGLEPYAADWLIVLPIGLGLLVGALGFPVIHNLVVTRHEGRRWVRSWSLHTKLTMATSFALLIAGMVLISTLERDNERTLAGQDPWHRLLSVFFTAVNPRSGGFSTVDTGDLRQETWLVIDALMFVGGGSASTAGGIKVTTLAVMLLAIVAEARGDRDIEVFGRRVPRDTLRLSIAVVFIGATAVLISCVALLRMTEFPLSQILFEVLSAYATVGLSTGITGLLPDAAKYWLCALMFLGRVGTISVLGALALRDRRRIVRFPEERPIIG